MRQNFSQGTEGWIAVGPAGSLEAKGGVLSFRYTANPSALNLAALPLAGVAFPEMKSLRFEIKTDSPMAAAVLLAEKKPGGGNYSAVVWSNGDSWQPVVLTPADFTVTDGPKDPVDSDHQLDLDQVENLALLDLSQFLTAMARNPNAPIYCEPHEGVHLISIRNFEISRDAPPSAAANTVDDFMRPQTSWLTFGGVSLENRDGGLLIRYRQMPAQWLSWTRQLPMRDYRGATHLAMDIASEQEAQLVLSFRERRSDHSDGAVYNAEFLVPASSKPEHREIALSAFEHDENGAADSDGKLDLDSLQSLSIVDVSGGSERNMVTIRDLKMVKK